MKDESVVKLSATAAMCEYILSTSLEHSRYTSLSGPSKKKTKQQSMLIQSHIEDSVSILRRTQTYREDLAV